MKYNRSSSSFSFRFFLVFLTFWSKNHHSDIPRINKIIIWKKNRTVELLVNGPLNFFYIWKNKKTKSNKYVIISQILKIFHKFCEYFHTLNVYKFLQIFAILFNFEHVRMASLYENIEKTLFAANFMIFFFDFSIFRARDHGKLLWKHRRSHTRSNFEKLFFSIFCLLEVGSMASLYEQRKTRNR